MKRIDKYKKDLIDVMDQTGLTLLESVQKINPSVKTEVEMLEWLHGESYEPDEDIRKEGVTVGCS